MLPTSRNTTYAAASQVMPNDLDDLEDCIIGNKHGTLEVNIDASLAQDSSDGVLNANGYITAWSTLPQVVHIAIEIPVGKRILSVEVFYNVNGTGSNLTPKLCRRAQLSGTSFDVVAGSTDNTGAAIESQVLTANHIVLAGNTYYVQVGVGHTNQRVHGVKVLYDAL